MNKDDVYIEELPGGGLRIHIDDTASDSLAVIEVRNRYKTFTVRTGLRGNFDVQKRPIQWSSHSLNAPPVSDEERQGRRVAAYMRVGKVPPPPKPRVDVNELHAEVAPAPFDPPSPLREQPQDPQRCPDTGRPCKHESCQSDVIGMEWSDDDHIDAPYVVGATPKPEVRDLVLRWETPTILKCEECGREWKKGGSKPSPWCIPG